MPDQAEAVKRQILGKCVEIIDKPDTDWVRFNIDVGTQYPIGLSTKLPKLIEEARAVGGDTATWSFTESQGKPNPNRPGTFYMNRYLDKVEEGEHVPAGGNAPVQTALPVQAAEPVDWDAKERRDYRSRAWAQTLGAFNHTIKTDEDPKAVFERLWPFQRRIYKDIVRDLGGVEDDTDIPF